MTATAGDALVPTAAMAEAVVERAAAVTAAGMPLAVGLRAAAQEAESRRLGKVLRGIAAELDRGRSLEDCLSQSRRVPPHLAGLVAAAQRTGEFGPVLAEWIECRRAVRQRWQGIVETLLYPTLAIFIAAGVFLFLSLVVVPAFGKMFEEFDLKMPIHTLMVLWACNAGSKIAVTLLAAMAVACVVLRILGGRTGWSLIVTSLPIIGLPWHWTGVAEMLRVLSLLVEQHVPLPEALRLAASGLSDAYIASQCRLLAARVERGTSLTMAIIQLRTLPLSIAPLVYWGERHGLLAEGLRSASEMIEGRLNFRTDMLLQVIPPILLVLVGAMVASMVTGLFMPLISLIQGLS